MALGSNAMKDFARLGDVLDMPIANQTALGVLISALDSLRDNASTAVRAADNLRKPLASLNLDVFMKVTKDYLYNFILI